MNNMKILEERRKKDKPKKKMTTKKMRRENELVGTLGALIVLENKNQILNLK